MASYPHHDIQRTVLLAPALALHPSSLFIRMLTPLRGLGIALPSLAPREYRDARFTSLRAYHSLFSLVDALKQIEASPGWRKTAGLVLLAEDDELVSYRGVAEWLTLRGGKCSRCGPGDHSITS